MNESGSDCETGRDTGAATDPASTDSNAIRASGSIGLRSSRCGRLRYASEFGRVRAEGRSWSSPLLVLQAAPGETDTVRVGFVVSKRIGKAFRRNRVRRLLREAIRRDCSRIQGGWDLVIIARSRIVGEALDRVQAALDDLLKRAGLLDGPPVATESPTGGFPFTDERSSDRTSR